MYVRERFVSFDFSLTLFSWSEGALLEHNVDCSSASQEMPQLQITDQAKHVWRWAFRGINSPPSPPSALTPVATFITGRENIIHCPLTNTCQFQEKELLFFFFQRTIKCFSELQKRSEKRRYAWRSTFFPFSLSDLLPRLSPSASLWPPGPALPLI